MENAWLAHWEVTASQLAHVTLYVPAVEGVPLKVKGLAAVLPFVIPGGRPPAQMPQPVYEPLPPVAVILAEYELPAMPAGSELVVILRAGPTVIESALVALWLYWSVTWTVKL